MLDGDGDGDGDGNSNRDGNRDGGSAHPPEYADVAPACAPAAAVLLNLVPLHDNLTFQLGHLGHGPATLEGDVQAKFAGADQASRPEYGRLELTFRGVERAAGHDEIELTEQRVVVWGERTPGSSTHATARRETATATATATATDAAVGGLDDFPPASVRFKLELTPDLPHCLHLGTSSLEYSLTATLYPTDPALPPISKTQPVHLVRSAPAGSLLAALVVPAGTDPPPSITPETLSVQDPVELSVRLARTVFRRSEPIDLVARIEVPSAKAVQEDGVRLRTVSAELVRIVTVSPGAAAAIPPARDRSDDADPADETPPTVANWPLPAPVPPRETVLARSGKSARFSPTRPIVIRLLLHPPSSLSCESITQSTILHTVAFKVRVTVGLSSQATSVRRDVVLAQAIFIIPDPPSPSRSSKQREVETYAESSPPNWMPADGPVPSYHESESEPAQGSGSGSWGERAAASRVGEEEYDGYEELSATLSSRAPPPTIDEDVSPPDASADAPPGVDDESYHSPLAPNDSSIPEASDSSIPLTLSFSSLLLASEHGSSTASESPPSPPHDSTALPPPYAGGAVPRDASPEMTSLEEEGAVEEAVQRQPPPYETHQHLVGVTRDGTVLELV